MEFEEAACDTAENIGFDDLSELHSTPYRTSDLPYDQFTIHPTYSILSLRFIRPTINSVHDTLTYRNPFADAQTVDLLDALVHEWNLDRPPMYRLEDAMSM